MINAPIDQWTTIYLLKSNFIYYRVKDRVEVEISIYK